ncbi:MAG: hypothetical protein WCB95_01930 [Aeromicrobium sp.]
MPDPEETSPAEIRNFVRLQLGLTALFLVILFALLGGTDSDRPAIWMIVLSLAIIALGAVLAERAWLRVTPLVPSTPDPGRAALDIYVSQTVRKFVYCEGALLVCVILAFASDRAGWLILIAGIPGLAVLAFETWPTDRNLSLTEAMLDAKGAKSGLLEGFETR